MIVSNPFAVHADRDEFLELADLHRVLENPLGNPQPHHDRLPVQRLGEKVVDACLHGLADVVAPGVDGRKKDEVGVIRTRTLSDPLTELQAVDTRHHPVAHNHPEWLLIKQLPRLLAIGRRHDFMPVVLQSDLQNFQRNRIVFGEENFHFFK